MRRQDKEIEIPTTLGYNLPNRDSSSSSSKLSSPTVGERSSSDHDHDHHDHHDHDHDHDQDQPPHQTHTLIFNEPPHHSLYPPPPAPPPPIAPRQPHRPISDPDLSTPTAPTSNPPRTAPPQTAATTSAPSIRYRECLRNHAASMGSHVVDGCGEFMASGEEGTPGSLRCAACECHRNFHRKEVEGEQSQQQAQLQAPPQAQHVHNYHSYYPNKHNGHLHFPTPSSSLHHRLVATTTPPSLVPPVMMAFGGPAESSSEDLNMFQSNTGAQLSVQAPSLSSKKRFRTKFSQQQKDRMMEFADKISWKIQKHNEQEVQHFCSQVGVKRQVFKVWMHNNKQTISHLFLSFGMGQDSRERKKGKEEKEKDEDDF
ncbi:Zinc-finger homeodomain protein 6, partial [Mucuna pruriens]